MSIEPMTTIDIKALALRVAETAGLLAGEAERAGRSTALIGATPDEARALAAFLREAVPGRDDFIWQVAKFFDEDLTAGSFLREDGEGGFVGAIDRMAREIDRLREAVGDGWRPIETAPKDGTIIWAKLRDDIYPVLRPERDDLTRWNGVQVPLRHPGISADGFDIGWSVAAPVGHGGLPDEWIEGFIPLPSPPTTEPQE